MTIDRISRRDFVLGTAGAGLLASSPLFAGTDSARNRVGLVGTGIRGTRFWGRYLLENYGDVIQYAGLCDINPGRLAFAAGVIGTDCPQYTDFDRMLDEAKLDTLIVTTVDSTHHEFIAKGLERGLTVISEKPMTTDEVRCRTIIDAKKKGGRLLVGLNYRYGGIHSRLKEILQEETVGRLTSVDFHWYLNTYHGASYFRRWHGLREKGGTLLLHKAAHHFDLLNWWIGSDPVEVHAYGALEKYGANNPFRGPRCMDCPHSATCDFYWDMKKDDFLMKLYHANEAHDGYIRDNCLWREEIDIFDKMAVQIRYANDVQVSYSLTTYSPYEGFRVAFNGMDGRVESWEGVPALDAAQVDQSMLHAQEMSHDSHTKQDLRYHEIVTQRNFREFERELLPYVRAGHWGGDPKMLDSMFRGIDRRPGLERASGLHEGVMSVLVGIAARKSIDEGRPVRIAELV